MLAALHEADVLTFVLDFKDDSQPTTVDELTNTVTNFDVTAFGFSASEFESLSESILRRVRDDFFEELVGTAAGPIGQDLAMNVILGDIGTPPTDLSEFYFIQIGTGLSGPNTSGDLGVSVASGVRDQTGAGPHAGVSSGDVIGSVFTNEINLLTQLTPPDALTTGRLNRTGNAIAGVISQQIGNSLSLELVSPEGSVQPTAGVPPLMADASSGLANLALVADREFSIVGNDPVDASLVREHVRQLADVVGLRDIPAGTVSGTVFNDVNQDGVFDESERGVRDVIVFADLDNDTELDRDEPFATTSATGEYTITGIVQNDPVIRQLSNRPLPQTGDESTSVVITEFSEQTPDFIELQNVSGEPVDTTGWFLVSSDGFNNSLTLNSASTFTFSLPSSLAAGELLTVTDVVTDENFWGTNLNFVTAAGGWVLLVDDEGVVQDSFFAGFSGEEIADFNVTANGRTFTADNIKWNGDGVSVTTSGTQSYQRVGLSDTNRANDFVLQDTSENVTNVGLNTEFGRSRAGRVVEGVGGSDVAAVDLGVFVPGSGDPAFFTGLISNGNRELYVTDGSADGTSLVRDLSGAISSDPQELTWSGQELLFTAETNSGQRELYASDGTFSGTRLVRDLSGSVSSNPQELIEFGGTVFFTALRSDGQRELFRSDGTFPTTSLVRDLSGTTSSDPQDLTVVGDRLFFTATTSSGQRELFVTDGTFAGTSLVRDLSGGTSASPQGLVELGGLLYFSALQSNGQRELFVSDGTFAGTSLVVNVNGNVSGDPEDLTPAGQGIYFSATVGAVDRELYFTDGTAEGTILVTDLPANGSPSDLMAVENTVYFVGRHTGGTRELFVASQNGTQSRLVRDLSGDVSSTPRLLTPLGDRLAFTAVRSNGNRELHVTDGTFTGTSLVRDLSGSTDSEPRDLEVVGESVVFGAARASGEREVFLSNGSFRGTIFVTNLNGSSSLEPEDFTAAPPASSATHSAGGAAIASLSIQASFDPLDVNQDGDVTVRDALAIMNLLARDPANGEGEGDEEKSEMVGDVTGDGLVSPRDALFLINRLARLQNASVFPVQDPVVFEDGPSLEDDDSSIETWLTDQAIEMLTNEL
ncbi:MAG: dockerin type I domain-containing protein [Planctomycetota bacterium]